MNNSDLSSPLPHATIGVGDVRLSLHNINQIKQAALTLFSQGKRNAFIYSHDLEPRILDDVRIARAVSELARYSRYSRIEVLLSDVDDVMARGHRWLELFQRLSSKIEVRVIHDDYQHIPFAFSIVDECALLYRSNTAEYEGSVHFNDRHACAQKLIYFREVWDMSRAASELRRLFL